MGIGLSLSTRHSLFRCLFAKRKKIVWSKIIDILVPLSYGNVISAVMYDETDAL